MRPITDVRGHARGEPRPRRPGGARRVPGSGRDHGTARSGPVVGACRGAAVRRGWLRGAAVRDPAEPGRQPSHDPAGDFWTIHRHPERAVLGPQKAELADDSLVHLYGPGDRSRGRLREGSTGAGFPHQDLHRADHQ